MCEEGEEYLLKCGFRSCQAEIVIARYDPATNSFEPTQSIVELDKWFKKHQHATLAEYPYTLIYNLCNVKKKERK